MLLSILSNKDEAFGCHMLSLRCLTNMFKHPSSVFILISKYETTIDGVTDYISHEKKQVRNAAVTVLLNYSCAFLERKENNEGRVQILACVNEAIENEKDPNTYMKILATIGNLIFEDEEVQSLAKDFGIIEKLGSIEKFKGKDGYEKSVKYVKDIKNILG